MAKRWNIILPLITICVVAVVIFIKRDKLGEFVDTVTQVQFIPFLIAFVCLFGRYFTHAFAYKSVFRCVDEEVPYTKIVPLTFSVTFANDVAPTAGTAGSVLIAGWSHKQGLDMGKSVSIVFYEKIGYFGGFAVVMLIGFVILLATGQLTVLLVIGSFFVFQMIAFVLVVLIMSKSHEKALLKMMFWIEAKLNWFMTKIHKNPIKPWAERICGSFHDASVIAFQKPRTLISMFARMVGLHLFDCACFIFSAMAFGVFETFGLSCIPFLVATYVAGFVIATFIPQTFGLVEVAIAEILVAYGVMGGAAYAIAICYRGLIFWIPFALGAICINITGKFDEEETQQGDSPQQGDSVTVAQTDGPQQGDSVTVAQTDGPQQGDSVTDEFSVDSVEMGHKSINPD